MDQFLPKFRPNEEATVVPQFFMHEGIECVRVLKAGDSRSIPVFRADDMWPQDEYPEVITYKERFESQYKQFKDGLNQTANGTPLEKAPFLNPSRIADLRREKVFSIESLAQFDDRYIYKLGGNGYKLKELAQEFLQNQTGLNLNDMQAEIARLRAQIEGQQKPDPYEGVSDDQLKDRIAAIAGKRPSGNPKRETLIQMLNDLSEEEAA